jgi:flagellin-like protein
MKFNHRRAVSPIIASLLLIAIAVAAGIIVYVYVNSLAGGLTSGGGQQVSQQLQLQAYTFNPTLPSGVTSGTVADVFLENTGSSTLTISAIYFDGNALVEWGLATGDYATSLMVPNSGGSSCFASVASTTTFTVVKTGTQTNSGSASGCTSQASAACTATNPCLSTTPTTPPETLTISAQGTDQLMIGLVSGATSGTSHTIKIVTANGGVAVFTVVAGKTG